MKRKWLKSAMAIGIVTAIIAGLCACGKSGAENTGNVLATENVYSVTSVNILPWVNCEDSYITVRSAVCTNEGVCAVMELQDRPENREYYGVLTADEKLSDLKIVPLELPENQQKSDEDISYRHFLSTAEGRVYGIRVLTGASDAESANEYEGKQRVEVCCWNTEGKMLWNSDIPELYSREKAAAIQGIYGAEDASVNLLLVDDEGYKIHLNREGEPSSGEKLRSAEILSECFGMWPGADGAIRILYPDEEESSKAYLVDYNIDTDTFGEPYELPFPFERGRFETLSAGRVSDLIYTGADGIFTYNKGDGQGTLKMNYVNSDVNVTYVNALLEIDENRFWAFYKEDNETPLKAGIFSYVKPEDVAERKVIVLGGNHIDNALRQRVIAFNRTNNVYRILLKEYDYDEYSGTYLQLNQDIAAGNMPDILAAEGLPVDHYIENGLIADLKPLIEQDEELSKKAFLENVFDAYSADGKWMYVVPSFMVCTAVAKTSIVGDGTDWSWEKVRQILAGMDTGTQFMSEMTKDRFMETALEFCGNELIDMGTGKCHFDSDEFIALLEFADTLPEEIDPDTLYSTDDYWEGYEAQYRDNVTLLMELDIDSLNRSLNYQLNGYMGEEYTFVGFPGSTPESTSGAYIRGNDLFVLSAKSEHLAGAWEFVRYYLTDEYQDSLDWGLPVNKAIFLEKAQKLTERAFRTNENGEKVEYDDTLYYHGEEVPILPMTQTQVEQLTAYIESVRNVSSVNEEVSSIINEELEAFYAGDKTAEETAKLVQNRVRLYLDERQ